jgi:hypothetical protein
LSLGYNSNGQIPVLETKLCAPELAKPNYVSIIKRLRLDQAAIQFANLVSVSKNRSLGTDFFVKKYLSRPERVAT